MVFTLFVTEDRRVLRVGEGGIDSHHPDAHPNGRLRRLKKQSCFFIEPSARVLIQLRN